VPTKSIWGSAPFEGYAAANSVANLPQLNLPSVWQMALFLLIYTGIVGPLNYLVLKRRNHLERAWLTIPLLILGFTAVTYFTGFQLRGSEVLLNQMAVSYSQAGSQQARVHSLIGLYSPRRETYDLILPADTLARPFSDSFGASIGGSQSEAITFSNENSIDGIRVDISDVETFMAQTDRPAPAISGQGILSQEGSRNRLEATIQNNSEVRLDDSVLILGDAVIDLGDLAPGESETISHIITAVASSGSGTSSRTPFASPNQPLTSHASEILGFDYYNDPVLYPRYQFLEALQGDGFSGSSLKLPSNVAILLGWSTEPLIDLGIDSGSSSQHDTTLYFIEIPLSQNLSSDTAVTVLPYQLDWTVLANNGVGDGSISNLRLNGGWIEIEFQPWADFQELAVADLAIVLENADPTSSYLAPEVHLWNWQVQAWQPLDGADWGETAVINPASFLDESNSVRIRLDDRENAFENVIQTIYPSLSGSVE
jgi:hypothetical protein